MGKKPDERLLPNFDMPYMLESEAIDYVVLCGFDTDNSNADMKKMNGLPLVINASSPSEAIARAERYFTSFVALQAQQFGMSLFGQLAHDFEKAKDGDKSHLDLIKGEGAYEKISSWFDLPTQEAIKEIGKHFFGISSQMIVQMVEQNPKIGGVISEFDKYMPISYYVCPKGKEFEMFGSSRAEVHKLVNGALGDMVEELISKTREELDKKDKKEKTDE